MNIHLDLSLYEELNQTYNKYYATTTEFDEETTDHQDHDLDEDQHVEHSLQTTNTNTNKPQIFNSFQQKDLPGPEILKKIGPANASNKTTNQKTSLSNYIQDSDYSSHYMNLEHELEEKNRQKNKKFTSSNSKNLKHPNHQNQNHHRNSDSSINKYTVEEENFYDEIIERKPINHVGKSDQQEANFSTTSLKLNRESRSNSKKDKKTDQHATRKIPVTRSKSTSNQSKLSGTSFNSDKQDEYMNLYSASRKNSVNVNQNQTNGRDSPVLSNHNKNKSSNNNNSLTNNSNTTKNTNNLVDQDKMLKKSLSKKLSKKLSYKQSTPNLHSESSKIRDTQLENDELVEVFYFWLELLLC